MFVPAIKCTSLDGSNGSMLIHHLVIKFCLELMRLRSSVLLLVINIDSLQYERPFKAIRQV